MRWMEIVLIPFTLLLASSTIESFRALLNVCLINIQNRPFRFAIKVMTIRLAKGHWLRVPDREATGYTVGVAVVSAGVEPRIGQ